MPSFVATDGIRLDCTRNSPTVSTQIIQCAFAYRLTGNDVYLKRATDVMMTLVAFDNWNTVTHFLDTANIMFGMAFGYDWLYNELTTEQKTAIEDALMTKGIKEAFKQHEANKNGTTYSASNWSSNKDNWTFVCNSATLLAALAISGREDYRSDCADIISKSLKSMEGAIRRFSIDGAWWEGTNYGQYAMEYFMPAMEAMITSIGTDYGYGTNPGIMAFNDFVIYTNGARSTFNFGDGGEAICSSPTLSLYSLKSGNKLYGAYRTNQIATNSKVSAGVWDVIWYNPSFKDYDMTSEPKDKFFAGIDTAVFRSGIAGAVNFAGLHGGNNGVSHGHLDTGSFVYDVKGVRFASDLGQDNYNLKGYGITDPSKENNRWNFYRTRAEGHNTLVINPDSAPDQVLKSVSKMIAFKSYSSHGYAILDTTPAYSEDVTSSKRGMIFNRENSSLLVQDELTLKSASDIYWFMHFGAGSSGASMTVSEDGKSAVLVREGIRVWVGILSDGGKFTIENAAPLSTSPNPEGQATNSWYKKLQILLNDVEGSQRIAVYMVPLSSDETTPSILPEITSLNTWQ